MHKTILITGGLGYLGGRIAQSLLTINKYKIIIAKHTSIGEELIALNKPVLFYDFLPNMDKLMSSVYDYNSANIFVYSYIELERRAKEVLYNNHYLTNIDLQELQKNVNNGPADGNVKIRIMDCLEDLYSNLPVDN
jgi:short-subunit dehydrogenase involved in D-alanine esterification of teichoic acids